MIFRSSEDLDARRARMTGDLSKEDDIVFLRESVADLTMMVDVLLSRQVNVGFASASNSSLDRAAEEFCAMFAWPRLEAVKTLVRQRMGKTPNWTDRPLRRMAK